MENDISDYASQLAEKQINLDVLIQNRRVEIKDPYDYFDVQYI
jgi:hypothetical protein